MTEHESVFAKYTPSVWPYRFAGTLFIPSIAGGTPSDPNVAEGWIRSKTTSKHDLVRDFVMTIMAERGISLEEATQEADRLKHLNGFKRNDQGLYIDGRQLKAAIKEAASVARAADKLKDRWGTTRKGVLSFTAEHIQVVDDRLYLHTEDGQPVTDAHEVVQSFPKNARTGQTGIQYTEVCHDVMLDFTVISDWEFTPEEWAIIWGTGEMQGVGATRSQGMGRYSVVRWDQVAV
jgi:hypothetical protein